MLPSPNRLPAPFIRSVLHKGRRSLLGSLQMVFSPTTAPEARFAFVVSTAVDRRATARNRMKRLLRESVRALLPRVQSKVDAVVVAKKGLPDTQMAVDSLVKELFTQAGLL